MKRLKFKDRDIFNWKSDKGKERVYTHSIWEINAAAIQDGMIAS